MIPNFIAGESVKWCKELADYPASSWAVTYHLRGVSSLDITGVGTGIRYEFAISPAQSANLQPGRYFFQAFATKSTTDQKLVDSGQIEIKPSLLTATAGFDGRSYAEITLENVVKALGGIATDGVQGYVIQTPHGSREIRNYSLAELTDLHKYFSGLVAQEYRVKNGGSIINHQFYSFGG